ncbi:DUF128 domain-containing protein [bacterium]|nr:DUF128 domain-containing protein [bacterium]
MEIRHQQRIVSILTILNEAGRPLGGTRIAQKLQDFGFELSQRTVRNYLMEMDQNGLTLNLGKKGRRITPKGEEELRSAFVINKVGFIASKIDALTCQMDFSLRKQKGRIILNISTMDKQYLYKANQQIQKVFRAGIGMGRFLVIGLPCARLGTLQIDESMAAIGTVCSVTINGILLSEGIPVTSRFGGLLEMANGAPFRFTEIIHYDGSSIDPLEIFIKGGMTDVLQVVSTGNGRIGASFREFPSVVLPKVEKIKKRLDKIGLGGILMIGKPGRPLLEIPVPEGRAGMIVSGGLNPMAAVEEAGITTDNKAMKTLFGFDQLIPYWEVKV